MAPTKPKPRNAGAALSTADQSMLRRLYGEAGIDTVAQTIGVHVNTIYRACRGESVRHSVRDTIRSFLADERKAAGSSIPTSVVSNAAPIVTKDNATAIGKAVSDVTSALLPLSTDARKRVLDSVAVLLA